MLFEANSDRKRICPQSPIYLHHLQALARRKRKQIQCKVAMDVGRRWDSFAHKGVLLLVALLVAFCGDVDAQRDRVISTSANEFVVGFMRNYVKPSNYRYALLRLNNTYLFVTTDHPEGVTVTVTYNNEETVHTISPSGTEISAATLQLPTGTRVQGDWDRNKGIRVKAEGSKHISVQCFSEEIHSVEGYTALPCVYLPSIREYVYYALSVPRSSVDHSESYRAPKSLFLIVACEDNTQLTITPTQRIENPSQPGSFVEPGQNITLKLNALETLQIEHLEDLTGSRIVTSSPITFISGHECGNMPYDVNECDHLVEQLPPTVTWGKDFMISTSSARTVGDTILIMSGEDDTRFNLSCSDGSSVSLEHSGHIAKAGNVDNITLNAQQPFCHLSADNPVLVMQFTPGRYSEKHASGTGDPFMLMIPPTNQYTNKAVFSSAQGFDFTALSFQNYLNLFVPESEDVFNDSSILVNGETFSGPSWSRVFCSYDSSTVCGYSVRITAPEQQGTVVQHTSNEGTVGVTSYGISFLETYAYIGGMKITLSEGPVILEPEQTSFIILHNTSLCLPCELSHSFGSPDIMWQFNNQPITPGLNLRVSDNGTLCITSASDVNHGNYTCQVDDHLLEYQVSVTTGIVIESPMCLPEPSSDGGVLFGIGASKTEFIDIDTSTVEICCPTQGTVQSMQWYANEVLVITGGKYSIGSDFLRISGSFKDGCVIYTCSAIFQSSRVVSQSTEVCAGRIRPPSNVTIEAPMEVLESQPFTLTCSAKGFPLPEITWSRFGELLPSMTTAHENGTLSVDGLRGENDSEFCCVVVNTKGQRSKCISITVLVPPEILQPPSITNIITTNQATLPDTPPPGIPLNNLLGSTVWIAHAGQIVLVHVGLNVRIDCVIKRGSPEPALTWWKEGEQMRNGSRMEVYKNGSLLLKSVDKDLDGVYTCETRTSGLTPDRINTSISTIVSPAIVAAPPPYHSPGSCIDATKNATIHQQVGPDLCVPAKNTTRVYLNCETSRGVPKPNITWLMDHKSINSSDTGFKFFENGTILIESPLVPIEAKLRGQVDLSGLYTCVATNIAGIANTSSFVLPFGDISEEVVFGHIHPTQQALYADLHATIAEKFEELSSGEQHLALLTSGKILKHSEYNPGRDFDGSVDTIPESVQENVFKLTNVIPKGNSIVTDVSKGDSLSETYEYLVRQLRVVPIDLRPSEMQEARDFLQEKVEDLGSAEENITIKPRLSLYIKYKNQYYEKKLSVENQIDYQKKLLTGYYFSEWYERHASVLNAQVDDAYIQWVMYGYKADVEKWLKLLKLQDDGSSPIDYTEALEDAKSLLIATKQRSKFKEDSTYRPVKLLPDYWFEILENRVEESIEQLQYQIANLQSQKKVLEVTVDYLNEEAERAEYCNRPTIQFPIPVTCPPNPYHDPKSVVNQLRILQDWLQFEVEQSEMSRYKCLITRKPEDCEVYTFEHDIVLELMDHYADLYFVTQLVTAARDHRDISSPAILTTINTLERRIQFLSSLVQVQLLETADRERKEEDNVLENFKTPMNFDFQSQRAPQAQVQLPTSIRNRLLWHIESTHFNSGSREDPSEEYKLVTDYLNSVHTNVTANLVMVDVKRRWLKPKLFENRHLQLKNLSILVSPGPLYPPESFRESLKNDSYLFPLHPSSMLLATSITLTIHTPFPYFVLPTLLRMSYDPYLQGGFGPFVFGQQFQSAAGAIKFSVSVRDNDIIMHIPGTQLIGYLCDIVPQHPLEPGENTRRKRFVKANDFEERKPLNRFNQWLLLKNKEAVSPEVKVDTTYTSDDKYDITPSSTLAAYNLGQAETFDNTTIDSRKFKTAN